jgi:hypothetical protein
MQLEVLRLNNERRRLRAEEEERREAEQGKRSAAAKVIQQHWRKHAAKVRADINYQLEAALKDGGNGTSMDIVFMPSVRKCNICRKSNAVRQCGPGVSHINLLQTLTIVQLGLVLRALLPRVALAWAP